MRNQWEAILRCTDQFQRLWHVQRRKGFRGIELSHDGGVDCDMFSQRTPAVHDAVTDRSGFRQARRREHLRDARNRRRQIAHRLLTAGEQRPALIAINGIQAVLERG